MIQLQENTVVADRFRLVRMIGRGGMGSVWEAIHIGLETPCALKFIEGELANVSEAHARFEREAKVSAQLRSPNIVQIIDHGVWQGRPYIAMELLEGKDLSKLLAENGGKLSPSMVNMVVQQVCRALTKAHGAGIVHRDLKPDNIFVVNDDDRQIVKILDFGVAKSTGQAIEGSNTKTGAMLGTPYYMSPEQAQGIKTVDARSDLWSLAVIAYQSLTGKLPFESEALGDLLVKIIVQPVPIPSTVASVPPGFDRWWAKAAARDPDQRFQTAKELALELEAALEVTSQFNAPPSQPTFGQTAQFGQSPAAALGAAPAPVSGPSAAEVRATMQSPAFQQPVSNATFSGVEPPAGLPKKGVPVAVYAIFGVLGLVGLAGAGIAVTRTSASGHATTVASTTAATTATPDIPPPPPSATTTTTAGTTTAEPPPTTATAATTKPATETEPRPTTHPTAGTTPTPKTAPPASAKKKWDPGF